MGVISPAHKIANFGCDAYFDIDSIPYELLNACIQSDNRPSQYYKVTEPFGLLWTLDAKQIDVVEIEEDCVENAKLCVERLYSQHPECFHQDREINIIQGNMEDFTLKTDDYDIAYCEDVIKYSKLKGLKAMADCVKPGGLVIIVDDQNTQIDRLAQSVKGLSRVKNVNLSQAPRRDNTYVYRKF